MARVTKATRRSVRKKTRWSPKTKAKAIVEADTAIRGTNPARSLVFKGTGFPDRLTTNLLYTDSFILVPSAGNVIPAKFYRASSCFDPDSALGGGQPTYFDQLALIYNRYIVNGSKITVMFSRTSTTASDVGPYICGITGTQVASIATSGGGTQIQIPNTTYAVLAQDDGTKTVTASYSKKGTFPDLTDSLQATVGANPAVNWLFAVWASPQGVNVTAPVNVILQIEFNATFSDVKNVVDA